VQRLPRTMRVPEPGPSSDPKGAALPPSAGACSPPWPPMPGRFGTSAEELSALLDSSSACAAFWISRCRVKIIS